MTESVCVRVCERDTVLLCIGWLYSLLLQPSTWFLFFDIAYLLKNRKYFIPTFPYKNDFWAEMENNGRNPPN